MEKMKTCACGKNLFVRDDFEVVACKCGRRYYWAGEIEKGRPLPQMGEWYRHYKTKISYHVCGIAKNPETRELEVFYVNLAGELFTRELTNFMAVVNVGGEPVYRFTKI